MRQCALPVVYPISRRRGCIRVIQRILRHSHVAVTQACYIKTANEDAKAAMQKLETAFNDTYATPRHPSTGSKSVL